MKSFINPGPGVMRIYSKVGIVQMELSCRSLQD